MNYTENYHLPQWDETDRIMMDDFNQMCRNMEAGLTGNRDAAAKNNGSLQNITLNRFCRAVYNQYHAAVAADLLSSQVGMFYQNAAALPAKDLSGMVRADGYYVIHSGQPFGAYDVHGMITTVTQMSTDPNAAVQPLRFQLTAPAAGVFTRFVILIRFSESQSRVFTYQVSYEDLTEHRTVMTANGSLNLVESSGFTNISIENRLCIHIGHTYQVTLTPTRNDLVSTATLHDSAGVYNGASYGISTMGTAVYTFENPGENSGSLFMVNYNRYGNSNVPVLLWNGEEVPAWTVREISGDGGGPVQELIFRRDAPVAAGDTVTLRLSCGEGGEVNLYGWGAALL